MAKEFIVNGASGFNPDVDSTIQLTDSEDNVYKIKAKTDVGLEITKNGVATLPVQRVVAKTANYTLTISDHGTLFTNEGASGAVIFTLPATADLPTGWTAEFYIAADQNVTVTAGTADTMVADNELDADSVAFSTATELIGNYIKVVKLTGSLVATILSRGAEDGTVTIAD